MIRAILMDFNGVIIDDEPLQLKSYQEVLKDEGIVFTEGDYYKCCGMDDATFVRAQFANAGKTVDDEKVRGLIERKTAAWRKIVDVETPLFEGVENFIKKCSRRFAVGIVSMANRREIEHILTRTALADNFTCVISAEDVSDCKPNPECYIRGFQKLDAAGINAGHHPLVHRGCLVIEDTPQGVRAGKAAGMKVLGVTNTFDEKILREAGADSVTKNLNDWMPDSIARAF